MTHHNTLFEDVLLFKMMETQGLKIIMASPVILCKAKSGDFWVNFLDDSIYAYACECTEEERGDWLKIPNVSLHDFRSCQVCLFFREIKKNVYLISQTD